MKKDLKYYVGLPYKIEITQIAKNEGGGFAARIPEFGALGVVGDGETIEEAIYNLENIKEKRLKYFIEEGMAIPEPELDDISKDYSGKILTRMPKWLHEKLAVESKKNNSSLNQFVVALLAKRSEEETNISIFEKLVSEIESLKKNISDIKINLDTKYDGLVKTK